LKDFARQRTYSVAESWGISRKALSLKKNPTTFIFQRVFFISTHWNFTFSPPSTQSLMLS